MIYNFQLHDLVNDIGLSALNNQSRPELLIIEVIVCETVSVKCLDQTFV